MFPVHKLLVHCKHQLAVHPSPPAAPRRFKRKRFHLLSIWFFSSLFLFNIFILHFFAFISRVSSRTSPGAPRSSTFLPLGDDPPPIFFFLIPLFAFFGPTEYYLQNKTCRKPQFCIFFLFFCSFPPWLSKFLLCMFQVLSSRLAARASPQSNLFEFWTFLVLLGPFVDHQTLFGGLIA